MTARRATRRTIAAGLSLLVAACSTSADRYRRDYVSEGLLRLSGHDLGPGDGSIPPGVDLGDGLDEEEAVATALWNNPTFQAALVDLGLRRADLVVAGELPNPLFMILFPVGSKALGDTARIPFEFLWQRADRVAAATADCERAAALLMQGGLDLERDVRLAYAELRLTRARQLWTARRAELQGAVRAFTVQRHAAGDASEFEVLAADNTAARADADAIRARQAATLAESRIRALIGTRIGVHTDVVAGEVEPTTEEPAEAPAVTTAWQRRPDLRGARIAVEAAADRLGLSKAEVVAAQLLGDVNGSGSSFEAGPGLSLTIPLFQQGQGAAQRGEAALRQAVLRHRELQQRIEFEVRDAHTRWTEAERLATLCRNVLPPLRQAVAHAESAWRNGNQTQLPVLEANLALVEAKLQDADARAAVERATAELSRNTGGRPR